jgi:hypothetical protein
VTPGFFAEPKPATGARPFALRQRLLILLLSNRMIFYKIGIPVKILRSSPYIYFSRLYLCLYVEMPDCVLDIVAFEALVVACAASKLLCAVANAASACCNFSVRSRSSKIKSVSLF